MFKKDQTIKDYILNVALKDCCGETAVNFVNDLEEVNQDVFFKIKSPEGRKELGNPDGYIMLHYRFDQEMPTITEEEEIEYIFAFGKYPTSILFLQPGRWETFRFDHWTRSIQDYAENLLLYPEEWEYRDGQLLGCLENAIWTFWEDIQNRFKEYEDLGYENPGKDPIFECVFKRFEEIMQVDEVEPWMQRDFESAYKREKDIQSDPKVLNYKKKIAMAS